MRKLVFANWKMNPSSAKEARDLFEKIKKKAATLKHVDTVIAPPLVFLSELTRRYSGSKVGFSGQDVFWEKDGPFTGEVSAAQIKSVGGTHCIVGHSERRARGETDIEINKKIHALIRERITPVFCIGEKSRDDYGAYLNFLSDELAEGLKGISAREVRRIVVAYEPIWAIGKSEKDAMQPHDMHEMKIFIQKVLTELYERRTAMKVSVLYGGSVGLGNAAAILTEGEADGLLVGHASLVPEDFSEILSIAEKA